MLAANELTTETQRTQRLHRELKPKICCRPGDIKHALCFPRFSCHFLTLLLCHSNSRAIVITNRIKSTRQRDAECHRTLHGRSWQSSEILSRGSIAYGKWEFQKVL